MICGPFSVTCLLRIAPRDSLAAFKRHGYAQIGGTTPSRLLQVAQDVAPNQVWRLGYGSPAPIGAALPKRGFGFVRSKANQLDGHVIACYDGIVFDCLMDQPLPVSEWSKRTEFDQLFASVTTSGSLDPQWHELKRRTK